MGKGGKGKGKSKRKGQKGGKAQDGDAEDGDTGESSGRVPGKSSELHVAARSGDVERLKEMLKGVDTAEEAVNAGDQHRRSPLHLAAFFGHPEAVAFLLETKADVHRCAMDGFLPLHFAAQQGHLQVTRALLQHIRTNGEGGSIKRHVNRVVEKGKKSALHLAVQKGHDELARFLAMKGSSLDLKTSQGQTVEDLCKCDKLRAELRGASASAAATAATEEGEASSKPDAAKAEDGTEEPPAKRRAVESGSRDPTVESPGASPPDLALAARQSPAKGSTTETCEGVLCRGPLALDKIAISAVAAERSYPAGIAALADVHWTCELAETPALQDGPVWCLQAHSSPTEGDILLTMQRSSHKLLLFTHFSDEADMVAADLRCNACCLTLLLETADGLLVLHKSKEGQLWQTLPSSRIVTSTDLKAMLRSMLDEAGQLGGSAPSADLESSARCLALVDADEAAADGYRHELVFCLRLATTADAVQKACASAGGEPLFVRAPRATASEDERVLAVSFSAAMSGSFALTRSARRALQLFQEVPVAPARA